MENLPVRMAMANCCPQLLSAVSPDRRRLYLRLSSAAAGCVCSISAISLSSTATAALRNRCVARNKPEHCLMVSLGPAVAAEKRERAAKA